MNKINDVVLIRRDYNQWVANETLDNYALRLAAKQSRRRSPAWLLLQMLPLVTIALHESTSFSAWLTYPRQASPNNQGLDWLLFGAAAAAIFPLIAQNAGNVDFSRFLPPVNQKNKIHRWLMVVGAGPFWSTFGLKCHQTNRPGHTAACAKTVLIPKI
ncbi:MAG: hypothetical protein WBO73_08680 [Gammaproteobacteria bacterium]|jgi:hypothetical protein